MPSISVVVPTHNRVRMLVDTIESIVKADHRGHTSVECVVVANACTDRTVEVVTSLACQVPFTLRCMVEIKAGVNIARNRGILSSRGDLVVIIDDDELVPKHYLLRVLEELEGNENIAGVGGPCRDYGKGGPRTCSKCSLTEVDPPSTARGVVKRLLGGNMAVRRTVFDKVGLFDESISGRGDETEWFSRAHGMAFLYEPELWVWHRRDHFTLPGVIRHALKQGQAIPRAMKAQGVPFRPRPRMVAGNVWHGLRYSCSAGWVRAAREAAAIASWLKLD